MVDSGLAGRGNHCSDIFREAHDEWQVAERRYLSEGSMAQLTPPAPTTLAINTPPIQEVTATPAVQSA